MGARLVNAFLGLWLFLSAFFWPHSAFQQTNDWIAGIAVVTFALLAARGARWARYLNAAIGAWLILSAIMPPGQHRATVWNHLVVGFFLVLFAMLRSLRQINQHPGRL